MKMFGINSAQQAWQKLARTRRGGRGKSLFSLLIAHSLIFQPLFAASISPDGKTGTQMDKAQNGVDVVNIAKPNRDGVSHNSYNQFNIDRQGVIFNNSNVAGVSQLGGALAPNSNLGASQGASIILNEVTGNKNSALNGYAEIFGQRAEFILANPNGITCDGCGFINVSRAALITGTPDLSANELQLYLGSGEMIIAGLGLDARNTDSVDLVSRVHSVSAEILGGKNLNIYAGNHRFDYNRRLMESLKTTTSGNREGIAIDASAMGSMYAGRIAIVSTEEGFGVKNDGTLAALTDNLEISADGDIRLKDAYSAKSTVAVSKSGDIFVEGILYADNLISLAAKRDLTVSNQSVLFGDRIDAKAASIQNDGLMAATNAIDLSGGSFTQRESGQIASNNVDLKFDRFGLSGLIYAQNWLGVDSGSNLLLSNTLQTAKGGAIGVELNGNDLINNASFETEGAIVVSNAKILDNSGEITADSLYVNAETLANRGGVLGAKSDITIDANNVRNEDRALIYANKNGYLNADDISNTGASVIYGGDYVQIDRNGERNSRLENENSAILSGGGMTLKSENLINRYRDQAEVLKRENVKTEVQYGYTLNYYKDFALLKDSDRALIRSSDDMRLDFGTLTNNLSDIQSGGDLFVDGDILSNAETPLYANDFTHYLLSHSENYKSCKKILGVKYRCKTKTRTWTTDHFYETVTQYDALSSSVSAAGAVSGNLKELVNGEAGDAPLAIDYSDVTNGVRFSAANGGAIDPLALISEDGSLSEGNLNAMFELNKNQTAQANYLIESRANFVDPDKLLGSSYFLERIGYTPEPDIKRLGDNYVEQQLIMNALGKTDAGFLGGGVSDEDRFKVLLENGIAAALSLSLTPGVALSADQIAALDSDIVWYEYVVINGEKILAPKIYLSETSRNKIVIANGSLIEAKQIDLDVANNLYNSGSIIAWDAINIQAGGGVTNEDGTIKAGGALAIDANDIVNRSSVNALAWLNGAGASSALIAGENVYLSAANNIENAGASILSNDFLAINADKDFINRSVVSSFEAGKDRYEDLSSVAEVRSLGDALISAGGSIINAAGEIASGGDLYLTAQGDISFDAIALNNVRFYGENGFAVTETTKVNQTSSLDAQGNLIVSAHSAASFSGTDVSVGGSALVSADSLSIAAVADEYSKTSVKSSSTSSLVGGSAKKTVKTEGATINNGSDWTIGGDLQANIDGDLFVYGSAVSAQGNIALSANNINVLNAADSRYDQTTATKSNYAIRKSITVNAKAAANIGYTTVNKESYIVSNGSLSLKTSQGDINILGSNLSARDAILLDGANDVSIVAGYDGSAHNSQKTKSSLFTDWSFSKTTIDIEKEMDKTAVASNLNAQDIRIYSKGDLLVKGSNLNAQSGEITSGGNIDVKVAENIHFKSAERHVSKVGLGTVLEATTSGAIGSFAVSGNPLSGALQGFSDSTGFGGALFFGESLQNGGYREYRGDISTVTSVTASQPEIALGNSSIIVAKNDVNLEAADIEAGTIGAGYQREADGTLSKINSDANINITAFDETTTTQKGSYSESIDHATMMVFQAGKAAAVSKASEIIKGGIENNSATLEKFGFLGDIVGKEIPFWPLFSEKKDYIGQFIGGQLTGSLIGKLDPSFIDKPDINDPNIFDMKDPVVKINNSIDTTFRGGINVLP
jgi:filamentous hemagglutinin family protein